MATTAANVAPATLWGVPLSVISLVTLTCQNSALTIVLHYSRIRVQADKMYSAAEAVLLNELLKGSISLSIAFYNTLRALPRSGAYSAVPLEDEGLGLMGDDKEAGIGHYDKMVGAPWKELWTAQRVARAVAKTTKDVLSGDCWKLSIPACLYVVQNNLQFVAASNLDVPTFQVTYNLKILTTALFSVLLLRKQLTSKKWAALFFLAAGVAVVQLQSTAAKDGGSSDSAGHAQLDRVKGLIAVGSACMTSGLAGVYFELVLKGSKVDLWVRNVQLSLFSLLPALLPVFFPDFTLFGGHKSEEEKAAHALLENPETRPLFAYFGVWAWAVVMIQVLGGLVTALVIKFSDNIMKGFATSLAIILSFVAGVILFHFRVTPSFLIGACIVVGATYLYNQPDAKPRSAGAAGAYPLAHVHAPPSSGRPFVPSPPATNPSNSHGHRISSSRGNAVAGSSGSTASILANNTQPAYRRAHHQQGSISGPSTPDVVLASTFTDNGSAMAHPQRVMGHQAYTASKSNGFGPERAGVPHAPSPSSGHVATAALPDRYQDV